MKTCEYCNKDLIGKNQKRFCSGVCSCKYRGKRLKSLRIIKICKICHKEYKVIASQKNSKYCSQKCYWKDLPELEKGRIFGSSLFKADKSPRWKDGFGVYRKYSVKLFGKACQLCGSNRHVDTHHKDKNPRNNPLDGSNWMRLCSSCHHKLDGNWMVLKRDSLGKFCGGIYNNTNQ
jgi:hypothetical protein